MQKKVIMIFLFLQANSFLYGQDSPENIFSAPLWRKNLCLGIQAGYGINIFDRKISHHLPGGIFIHIPVGESLILKPQLCFFQKKSYWNEYYFEYLGITYKVQDAQLWRNWSFNLGLVYKKTKNALIGLGVSYEHIQLKRVTHPSNPFLLSQPDRIEIFENKTRDLLIKPGVYFSGTGIAKLNNDWAVVIEAQIKFIFVGSKYGDIGDAKMIWTVLAGIGYGIR